MTDIQIEIDDEALDALARLAKAKGLTVEEYALQVLREYFRKPPESAVPSNEMPS